MALRKAVAYSKRYTRPFTRFSKVKSKSYIKTVPQKKLVKMKMGKLKLYEQGQLPFVVKLISKEPAQLRDNAIEAARQYINNKLEKFAKDQFYIEVRIAPHHILRENKMLTGAGSDRMQTGMQLSFGKTMGRAALIAAEQEIFIVAANTEKNAKLAQTLLQKVKAKLPCATRIAILKLN